MEYVHAFCVILVAFVFAVSAVSKMRDLRGFSASAIALLPVVPGIRPMAMAIVAAEAAIPVLLVFPPLTPYGLMLACALLAAFSTAIAVGLRRGRRASCRCFGASSTPVGTRHLVRNAALFVIAGLGVPGPETLPPPPGMALAAVAGLTGAILVVASDDIVDLFARNP